MFTKHKESSYTVPSKVKGDDRIHKRKSLYLKRTESKVSQNECIFNYFIFSIVLIDIHLANENFCKSNASKQIGLSSRTFCIIRKYSENLLIE